MELEFERFDTPDKQGRLIIDSKVSVLKEILKPQVTLKWKLNVVTCDKNPR